MANFTSYTQILPSPNDPIGYGGQTLATGSGGIAGPGYASLKVDAEYQTMIDMTNSGRLVSRSSGYHRWKVDITYNPMTRAEFSPIYSFLLEKQGRLRPFFVKLPQYASSQNTSFSATLAIDDQPDSNTLVSPTVYGYAAGRTYVIVDGYTTQAPRPGDMFTFTDATDTNHTKAYKVTRVESDGTENTTMPENLASDQLRVHFSPPLQRFTAINATLDFTDPMIKVIMTNDVMSYNLKTDNLYVYSLSLEEVQ